MFMDAISAATTKKEPIRKRKRLPSASKENESSNTPVTGKDVKDTKELKEAKESKDVKDPKIAAAPMKFYQDTLEENESKDTKAIDDAKKSIKPVESVEIIKESAAKKMKKESIDEDSSDQEIPAEIKEIDPVERESNDDEDERMEEKRLPGPGCGPDGPPGVLALHRRKGPKKSLRWHPQESLEEIRYFELDENERVNVTKTFVDMKAMERTAEREAFLSARKLGSEDMMVEQIEWSSLIEIADAPELQNGINSKEKEIQTEREKTVLKTIYFNRGMIPDSPAEADPISYPYVEPQIMPLIDVTGNPDAVHDFTNMPWPESKGSPPHSGSIMDMQDMPQFNSFNQFPAFCPPGNNIGMGNMPSMGNMAMNNINNMGNMPNMGNMAMGMGMNGAHSMPSFNPMMGPPDMNQMPLLADFDNSGGFARNVKAPFHGGPPMGPNFGPNGPPNFGNFGPPMMNNDNNRGRNGPNWTKNNSPGPNWQPPMGGPPPNGRPNWLNRDRICKQFQRGYCRHGDRCKFLHPGVNCPPI